MWKQVAKWSTAVVVIVAAIFYFATSTKAAPATFTVTNTNDSGVGSLRQAIIDANNNNNPSDMDTIEFNIGGSGVKVISPASALPDITEKVTIDASTQPGASCDPRTIMVRLDGSNAGNANGFILWEGASGSTIKGFSIVNFIWRGVRIVDSNDNVVACNNIGLLEDGTTISNNDEDGITLFEDSQGNVIGGVTAADRNVISGNYHGILLAGNGATSNNVISGNYIGTDASGSAAKANFGCGIIVGGSSSQSVIGGTSSGAKNVISGNGAAGICIGDNSTDTKVMGNFIGLNTAGSAAIPNNSDGIVINGNATDIQIGGTSVGARNVISGNGTHGIAAYAGSGVIQQNYVGTNAEGTTAITNGNAGVIIEVDAVSYLVGGTASGAGNLISGNTQVGLKLGSGSHTVQGNYIGINASGDAAIGNGYEGIAIANSSNGNTIGGTSTSARNVIAGNGAPAILINTSNNEVYGNYIGLGPDGVTPILSPLGIVLIDGVQNKIGGPLSGQRNVITNTQNFPLVTLTGSAGSGNIIQGNYIGTNANGEVDPNSQNGPGVVIAGGNQENLIGGINPGEGNLIAGVRGAGVTVQSVTVDAWNITIDPLKNTILGNSIAAVEPFSFLNLDLANQAIDLGGYIDSSDPVDGFPDSSYDGGPNPNDPGDTDSGANNYINTPILKTAQQVGNDLTITYDLDAADSTSGTYRVEFFANSEATIFGTGPGEEYLGSATVTPGTNKTVTLTVSGDYTDKALSATTTAIDATTDSGFGSTSEFARNISIGSATDFDADGIADSTEDLGPNGGDGNNDGTPDRLQPTVTTYEIDSTGIYATLVTDGCSENGTVSSIDATSLPVSDEGKIYPYGLTDFTLNCSRGDTVNVTMYIHTETNPDQYVPRKYNATTQTFFDIPGSTLTTEQMDSTSALKLNYSITDGGDLDDDGEANGIIVDPMGLALTVSGGTNSGGSLAATGENLYMHLASIMTLLSAGVWALRKVREA